MACMYPFFVKNSDYPWLSELPELPVPCGKCPECLQRRASEWCFRIFQESKTHLSCHFITLTYEQPPMTPKGFMTLHTPDFQKFMKRLRKLHPRGTRIKYYAVGEYGTTRQRPHYHAILFGAEPAFVDLAWNYPGLKHMGLTDCQPMSEATVAYVCKYLHKGQMVSKKDQPQALDAVASYQEENRPVYQPGTGSWDDRKPEYSLMSKGLGANYLTPAVIDYHRADLSRTFITHNGYKKAMPRYYRTRLYDSADRADQADNVQQKSIDAENKRRQTYYERTGSMEGYENYVYESKKAQLINFKRRATVNRKDL